MPQTLIHDSVDIRVRPESYRTEQFEGKEYPVIDVLMLPMGKISRNGVLYRPESARKHHHEWVGTSVLYNHDDGHVIGDVIATSITDEAVYGTLRLDPGEEKIIGKIKDGFLKTGSIGVIVENEKEIEGDGGAYHIEVDIVDPVEFSIVAVPGFKDARIQSIRAQFIEAYRQQGITGPIREDADPAPEPSPPTDHSSDTETGDTDTMTDEKQSERLDKLEADITSIRESLEGLTSAIREMQTPPAPAPRPAGERFTPRGIGGDSTPISAPAPDGDGAEEHTIEEKHHMAMGIMRELYHRRS